MVVLWSIGAVAVFWTCLGQPAHTAEFQQKAILNDFLPAAGSLNRTTTRSKLECSTRCESVTGFVSFFYVQNTHACECHGTTYEATTDLINVKSAKYYEKEGAVYLSFTQVVLSEGVQFKYRAFVEIARSFDEAVIKCSEAAATLFNVITLQKFNFAMELMASPGFTTKSFWLCGVYNTAVPRWETIGGDPLPMTNTFWAPNRPNGNATQPCVFMSQTFDYKLDDRSCAHMAKDPVFTICEMP